MNEPATVSVTFTDLPPTTAPYRSTLPNAHDGGGLIERLRAIYRDSARSADRAAEEAGARMDDSAREFNQGWSAAMNHADNLARVALAAYRGEEITR